MPVIKKSYLIFVLIFSLSLIFNIIGKTENLYAISIIEKNIQPIKKVYLKKNGNSGSFCIDFAENVHFIPRIHVFPRGAKLILSFPEKIVTAPKTQKINHKLINGYFFERIGESSLLLVLSLKENVIFTEKKYTNNSIKLCFQIKEKHNIVIDAGHGGKDPGTKCFSGDYEKNITLISAIELRNELISSGRYNVILTRDDDTFISIEERKKIAEKADLLISLHTDSNNDRNVRGMSVYTLPTLDFIKNKNTLSITEDEENRENYYKTLSLSRKFARTLVKYIPSMCKFKKRANRNTELKILKVHFPAVLIEIGCVSNEIDNQLLHSKSFREKTNRAVLFALDEYFGKNMKEEAKKEENKELRSNKKDKSISDETNEEGY